MKLVRIPFSFMFSSFTEVCREYAARTYQNNKKELFDFTNKIYKRIFIILTPPLLILSFVAPYLFGLIFGQKWVESGGYIKFFAILVLCIGLYPPISSLVDVLKKQKIILYFFIITSILQILILYLGSFYKIEFKISILILSVVVGLSYLILNFKLRGILKNQINN